MKKAVAVVILAVSLAVVMAFSLGAQEGKPNLKVGDERYVCNCGEKCACLTLSSSEGKCTCGSDMVKAKVMKLEKGNAVFKAAGWNYEKAFKTTGKYACSCAPGCKCGTISQNPGKCTCGSELKKI
jgi:hypothetical protein